MDEKDVKMDCTAMEEKGFSKKFRIGIYFAIFLTGFSSLMFVHVIYAMVLCIQKPELLEGNSINGMAWRALFETIMVFCFISLIKIAASKKPFSKTLVKCFYVIGGIFIICSILFPLLPQYARPYFELFGTENFCIDGTAFSTGLLIIIFGRIIQYGFEYQREIDTMI